MIGGSAVSAGPDVELVVVPGGTFVMGDAEGDAYEAPKEVSVHSFQILRTEVTNDQFSAFVDATGT